MTVSEHEVYYLEVVTPETEAVRDVYRGAYGWEFGPPAPELGYAFVASLSNGSLCGIRAPMHDQEQPTVRAYVLVADVAASIKRAEELGATIAIKSMEIPGRGTIAIYLLGGIEQGLWQLP